MFHLYCKTDYGEDCYNIATTRTLTRNDKEKIHQIFSFALNDINDKSYLKNRDVIEYGYKKHLVSPWSTNASNIIKKSGITFIERVEKTQRIKKQLWKSEYSSQFDEMLHEIYTTPITSFNVKNGCINKTITIPIKELKKINSSMGLSLDQQDIDYYTKIFTEKYKRDPTNIELFDLSQSNSEHSRHWFFNGKLFIDSNQVPLSLFKMVKETLEYSKRAYNETNSVLAFCDNSSAIRGNFIPNLMPLYSDKSKIHNYDKTVSYRNEYMIDNSQMDIVFTAETHNFPTGIAPFPGAATGTGGRIRDNQSIGRGGLLVAGSAGYCVGNLNISGYELPWETKDVNYDLLPATPLKIEIEASNGASDYGNKIGEPIINGFTRSFGMTINNERIEWLKPIMFTGGIGQIRNEHLIKNKSEPGMIICRLGGPAYRIGFGGGSASSRSQDNKNSKFDICAVQRGDPEMENKLNKVIRQCIEMKEKNPIQSIHDQGAGGLGNVCKEIVEPHGGEIHLEFVTRGDKTMTDIEIWTCEYQEVNVCLVKEEDVDVMEKICKRENLIIDLIGKVIDVENIVVYGVDGNKIVDLELENILGKMPQKKYDLKKKISTLKPLSILKSETIETLCDKVFRLVSVGSKRFLTNKVDRSVTGLIAQQQCIGPSHMPLSNYAVVAQSHFSNFGAATAIGEQPIKGILSPISMADMTVSELITNIMWVYITGLQDIKVSGNWMWNIHKEGEKHALYETCKRMCDLIKYFGFALDGGKDSLSMSTTVNKKNITSPRQLVLSGYASCQDVNIRVTPELKSTESNIIFIDIAEGYERMGGSSLAHVLNQVGNEPPFLKRPQILKRCFNKIQHLIKRRLIISGHDKSDGGLMTTLSEMAIAGNIGISIELPDYCNPITFLFNEEVGIVIEVHNRYLKSVTSELRNDVIPFICLGTTNKNKEITISQKESLILSKTIDTMRTLWESTSHEIEKIQCGQNFANDEKISLIRIGNKSEKYYDCRITGDVVNFLQSRDLTFSLKQSMSNVYVAIIREEGSNGEREMAAVCKSVGFKPIDVTMSDLLESNFSLDMFSGVIFVGGFSYADTLGAASGWGSVIKQNKQVTEKLNDFFSRKDTFSLGVCNGCQLMVRLGLFSDRVSIETNKSQRFESRFSYVEIEKRNRQEKENVFFENMGGSKMGVWVAHGEGQFKIKNKFIECKDEFDSVLVPEEFPFKVVMRYIDENGKQTMDYPFNPNGSEGSIAGISTLDGRHIAMMPHPERTFLNWQAPWVPTAWQQYTYYPWIYMFYSAYHWAYKNKNKNKK